MKKLILFVAVCLIGCTSNPTNCDCEHNPGVEKDLVSVMLYLNQSGSSTKIYCDGVIVSYLQYQGEKDTILVPEGEILKARINKTNGFDYKTKIAVDSLFWVLP